MTANQLLPRGDRCDLRAMPAGLTVFIAWPEIRRSSRVPIQGGVAMKTTTCAPILLLSLAGLLAGCGGGRVASTPPPSTPSPTPPSNSVVIFPPSASLGPNGARGFTAFVNSKSGQGVLWSVAEGDKGGTIDNFGNYVAPATTGLYNVRAVSIADPSQHAE